MLTGNRHHTSANTFEPAISGLWCSWVCCSPARGAFHTESLQSKEILYGTYSTNVISWILLFIISRKK